MGPLQADLPGKREAVRVSAEFMPSMVEMINQPNVYARLSHVSESGLNQETYVPHEVVVAPTHGATRSSGPLPLHRRLAGRGKPS